jgi:hypothetical protein
MWWIFFLKILTNFWGFLSEKWEYSDKMFLFIFIFSYFGEISHPKKQKEYISPGKNGDKWF